MKMKIKKDIKSDGVDPNKSLEKECKQCGKVFNSWNRRKVYCEDKCRDYFNNHKGVKTRVKPQIVGPSIAEQNLEVVERLLDGERSRKVSFKKLFKCGFKFGPSCGLHLSTEEKLWVLFDRFSMCDVGYGQCWISVEGIGDLPVLSWKGLI
jgi:hypothetical protein